VHFTARKHAFHGKTRCNSLENRPQIAKKEKKNGRIEHQIRFYFVTLQPIYAVEAQNK
jgi:hypothetical protein